MDRSDLDFVSSFRNSHEMRPQLSKLISRPSWIIKVAEKENQVVGFIRYKVSRQNIKVKEVVVSPDFRRMGVASSLLSSLPKTRKIDVLVSERNSEFHFLLKKLGFIAVEVKNSSANTHYRFEKCQKY